MSYCQGKILAFCINFVLLYDYSFYRSVCSPRTSLTRSSMFTGLAFLELAAVTIAVNAGISPSTVLNAQALFQLMVLCTWLREVEEITKIFSVFAILRVTATTSTKARCAWDSGSLIVPDTMEVMTPTRAGSQCPESLLRKFLNLRLRSRGKTFIPAVRLHSCSKASFLQ